MMELANMRCVVLGGGGFVGTNLCRALVGRVASLRIFGRRLSFPEAVDNVEWISGDFTDTERLTTAISGCDVVFHLLNATTPASSNLDKVADLQANVVGTLRLLDACRAEGVRRVIFVSSGGTIYGIPKLVPTPESAPTSPITAYGVSKLAIEKYLSLYEYSYGLEYRALRVANPFGPYQLAVKHQGAIAAFMRQVLLQQPIEIWGDGSVVRDYIYIDDVVRAMTAAVEHQGPSRVFNIGSGEGRSLRDIVASIESVSGIKASVRYVDGRSIDVPRSVLDTRLAHAELGWQPQFDFPAGIRRTWDWIKAIP
jgi:UDP-glucose 4-epimerase